MRPKEEMAELKRLTLGSLELKQALWSEKWQEMRPSDYETATYFHTYVYYESIVRPGKSFVMSENEEQLEFRSWQRCDSGAALGKGPNAEAIRFLSLLRPCAMLARLQLVPDSTGGGALLAF